MIHKFREIIYLQDVDGNARSLQGCSLNNLPKLASLLEAIVERLSTSKFDTVSQLWLEDTFWRSLVTEALLIVGLKPDWFTPSMLAELLFPFEASDGSQCPGLIPMVCFPKLESKEDENKKVSIEEYRLQQLNNLVASDLATSVSDALMIADTLSNHEVDLLIENVRLAQEQLKDKQAEVSGEKDRLESEKFANELANDPSLLFGGYSGTPELSKELPI